MTNGIEECVARIEESIEIKRPREEVYDYMAKVDNLERCSDAIAEVRDAPGRAVEPGDTYSTVAKIIGQTIETNHRVVTAIPPELLEIEGKTGRTEVRVRIVFENTNEGTRVIQTGEGKPGGALRFAGPMFERTMRSQIQSDLRNLKRILEQQDQAEKPNS
jgi:uncharacterized membrane protein